MLSTAALILIVTSKVLGQDDRRAVKGQIYPLDMAPDSVDDLYEGCTEKMKTLVERDYFNTEIAANKSGFEKAWNIGKDKFPEPQDNLARNNLIAIYVYTGVIEGLYKEFNQDVRNGKQTYQNKTFSWYLLYYWLTRAIQILNETQNGCIFTYRGTQDTFKGELNSEIRFGSFASSSRDQTEANKFGTESCFEIRTCLGADVSKYSWKPNQKEVLIPPYETFKVTNIRKSKKKGNRCNTVFELKSTGIRSFLNCAVAKPMKYHNVIISD
ncbi:ecto-ADP-ribosyltransferase 5-like [Misgurnus anguillicaudatus]|uniref:ecto-ADP-ribosyltransferase 5-like n=1 Tax=Misgurnus anguillicaudatus TaxID=75329 RepID=UPI003CCFB201